jgi:hypothetical protein
MDSLKPRFYLRDVFKFIVIVCIVLACFSWAGWGLAAQADWSMGLVPLAVALFAASWMMQPRVASPRCESCGRPYVRNNLKPSDVCPSCRVGKASPRERRRLAAQGFVIIIALLLLGAYLLLSPFAAQIEARFGAAGFPLAVVAALLVFFAACVAGLVVRSLVTTRLMNSPSHALKIARDCAGAPGLETTFGRATVYNFDSDDLASMLENQLKICRQRFESLVGEPVNLDRPLRIFDFGKRSSFDAFFKRAFLYDSNLDGMYVPWATPTVVLTTEFPAYRLADLERISRLLLAYFCLDCHRKSPAPLWLQMGVGHLVAGGGDPQESARLNRRMLAALSQGKSLQPADIFQVSLATVVRLVRDWQAFASFTKYFQLSGQSCSVVEYLCAEPARREQFRTFLKEPAKKLRSEQTLQEDLGRSFDSLLAEWKAWVQGRGIGLHEPAPPSIQENLTESVLPIIQDAHANLMDRIQAIRDMGKAGYVFGADVLIDLLGYDDQIPEEEVVCSLGAISGLALGNDAGRWRQWYERLPRVDPVA